MSYYEFMRRLIKNVEFKRRRSIVIPFFFLLFVSLLSAQQSTGVVYRHIVRTDPPNHIHAVTVDLSAEGVYLYAEPGDLIPADCPGDVMLTNPFKIAERGGFLWAANSNVWKMVDGTNNWKEGSAAHKVGWVQSGGDMIFPPDHWHSSFWLDAGGSPNIGGVYSPVEDALFAVTGFWEIMKDGKILHESEGDRHPRTAIGFDKEGRYVTFVVVDGRMPGYSVGMSAGELALLMEELGCWNALNLDGGGSSIMIYRSEDGSYRRKNRGVMGYIRPLPMLFGVKKTE